MLTVDKNRLLYIIKIISVIILLLIPLNLRAEIPADASLRDWALTVQQREADFNTNPTAENREKLAAAYNNYGLIFTRSKQWSQAAAYLNKALSINPNAESIKQNLSNIYYRHAYELQQDDSRTHYTNYANQDAKNLLSKALELNPENVNALLLLGDIEYMNQQMPAAERAWKEAAALVPQNQQIQKRLAQIIRESEAETNMKSVFDPFFIIKIDHKVDKNTNIDITKMLQDIRTKVSRDLQFTQTKKLPVIVYSRTKYLDTLTEAPHWSEAAYDGKLRIGVSLDRQNLTQLYSNIIHEYTHAVIDEIIDGNIPKWLNEGIAKYEEYRHGVAPRIYVLALAYNTDNILPWDKIDESFTSPVKAEALLAYQQSFSFVFYLVERYGMRKLIKLLNSLGAGQDIKAAFEKNYNKSLEQVQKDWQLWLSGFIHNWAEAPADVGYQY